MPDISGVMWWDVRSCNFFSKYVHVPLFFYLLMLNVLLMTFNIE
jgi:hypothetical protein